MPGSKKIEDELPEWWARLLPKVRERGELKARLAGQTERQGRDSADGILYLCYKEHHDWTDEYLVLKFVDSELTHTWPRGPGQDVPADEELERVTGDRKRADTAHERMLDTPVERDEVDALVAALAAGDRRTQKLVARFDRTTNGKDLTPAQRARLQSLLQRHLDDMSTRRLKARPRRAYRAAAPGYIEIRSSYAYQDRIVEVREPLRLFYDIVRRFFPTRQALARLVRDIRASTESRGTQIDEHPIRHETDLSTTMSLLRSLARRERVRWPRASVLPAKTVLRLAALAHGRLSVLSMARVASTIRLEILEIAALLGSSGRLPRRSPPTEVVAARARAVLARLPPQAVRWTTVVELAALLQPPRFVVVEPPEGGKPPKSGRRTRDVLVRRVVALCAGQDLFSIRKAVSQKQVADTARSLGTPASSRPADSGPQAHGWLEWLPPPLLEKLLRKGETTEDEWRFWAMEWAAWVRNARRRAVGQPVVQPDPELKQLVLDPQLQRNRAAQLDEAGIPQDAVELDLLGSAMAGALYKSRAGAAFAAASACALIFDRSASECQKAGLTRRRRGNELRAHSTHPIGSVLVPFLPRPRRRRGAR